LGQVPEPITLADAEDRFVTQELKNRMDFPVVDVAEVIRDMGQPDLLVSAPVKEVVTRATLSDAGLTAEVGDPSDLVSLAPIAMNAPK
jgi:hypothetical protein